MKEPPVRPGDLLAGKYRVERVLGAGAMGVVAAARHKDLGQLVALKHLITGTAVSVEQRERFLREARAAVLLKSNHVARVLDVGTDERDAPYIVMEFLEGQDLAAMLKARQKLPFGEAVEYVLQACEAVGEAHAAGIVHRDLKPANMFLTQDVSGAACVKVLDFGISKLMGSDVALTHESQMLGSPLYMSPEQMSAPLTVDARSDVWALGIILYQLVAGKTPFHGETIHAVYALVLSGQPTPLGAYRPDAPPGFEAVIARCLAKDRAMRFADVAEFAAALVPYAPPHARVYADRVARIVRGGRASSASSAEIAVSMGAAPVMATAPLPQTVMAGSPQVIAQSAAPLAPTSPQSKRKPPGWIVGLVAVGAVLAFVGTGVLVYALGLGQTNPPPEQSVVATAPAKVEAKAEGAVKVEPQVQPVPVMDAPSAVPIASAVVPVATATAKAAAVVKSVETKAPAVPTVKTKKRNEDLYNP